MGEDIIHQRIELITSKKTNPDERIANDGWPFRKPEKDRLLWDVGKEDETHASTFWINNQVFVKNLTVPYISSYGVTSIFIISIAEHKFP